MTYFILFLIVSSIGLFFYELYKIFENEIAALAYIIKKNKYLINWFVFVCDIFINASQGIITICLIAFAFMFANLVGLTTNLSENDILSSNFWVLVFLAFYSIIISTIFRYIKEKIKRN